MKRIKTALGWMVLTLIMGVVTSCSKEDNAPDSPEPQPVAKTVILDTDIASSTDDVVTMVALYNLMDQGKVNLKAIMVDRMGDINPKFADLMNTYYGHPEIPIGMVHDGAENPKVWVDYGKMAEPETYTDEPVFKRTLSNAQIAELPDAAKLYRKILSQCPDSSVTIISIGFAANLARLLESEGDEYSPLTGVELVTKKVAAIHQQAGHFGEAAEPDYNFTQDKDHAYVYMDKCPVPMYFSPQECGEKFPYNNEDLLADLKSVGKEDSPLYHICTHHTVNKILHMWDAVTLMQMLHPDLFEFNGPSNIYVDDNMVLHKGDRTTKSNRYYLFPKDDASSQKIMEYIRQYVKGK